MGTVLTEIKLIILVVIFTLIVMNHAEDYKDCVESIDSIFKKCKACELGKVKDKIKFIFQSVVLEDIQDDRVKKGFVSYLYTAVSRRYNTKTIHQFCDQYGEKCSDCKKVLKQYGFFSCNKRDVVIRRIYYNLKIEEDTKGYMVDLIKYITKSVEIKSKKLLGVKTSESFCKILPCADMVKKDFPDCECNDTRDYLAYTFLNIEVNQLKNDFTKSFVLHIFKAVTEDSYDDINERYDCESHKPFGDVKYFCRQLYFDIETVTQKKADLKLLGEGLEHLEDDWDKYLNKDKNKTESTKDTKTNTNSTELKKGVEHEQEKPSVEHEHEEPSVHKKPIRSPYSNIEQKKPSELDELRDAMTPKGCMKDLWRLNIQKNVGLFRSLLPVLESGMYKIMKYVYTNLTLKKLQQIYSEDNKKINVQDEEMMRDIDQYKGVRIKYGILFLHFVKRSFGIIKERLHYVRTPEHFCAKKFNLFLNLYGK